MVISKSFPKYLPANIRWEGRWSVVTWCAQAWGQGYVGEAFSGLRNKGTGGVWGMEMLSGTSGSPEPTTRRRLGQETNLPPEEITYLEFRKLRTTFSLSLTFLALYANHQASEQRPPQILLYRFLPYSVWCSSCSTTLLKPPWKTDEMLPVQDFLQFLGWSSARSNAEYPNTELIELFSRSL